MKYLIVLVLASVLGIAITNVETVILAYFLLAIGEFLLYAFNKYRRKYYYRIFFILFITAFLYSLICRQYMIIHNYDWLLSFDTINYYLPTTQEYIEKGSYNYVQTLKIIFEDWNMLVENQYAYWAYTTLFGIISLYINSDFYVSLQLSTIFLFAFCGIFLFKIMNSVNFKNDDSYKYTLYICIFSVVFTFSTQIMRDIHILLTYLIGIYLTLLQRTSIKNLAILVLLILITMNLRVESGIFMFSFLPIALVSGINKKKVSNMSFLLISLIMTVLILFSYYNSFLKIYNDQYEGYTSGVSLGEGMIALFQRIPIIGDFLSIIYNAVQPWPFWSRFSPSVMSKYGGEAYNIMNFTGITSSFVNFCTVVLIFFWLINNKLHLALRKTYKYHLLLGLLFLYLQSAIMAQRRIMAYYCIYYVLAIMIFQSLPRQKRRGLVPLLFISFIIFHLFGSALSH